ncbi:DNA repair exonuclease [Thermostilla marina]
MRDRILHLADLHLGANPAASLCADFPDAAEQFRRNRDGVLERIADWVEDEASRVGLVLIAGDLFHRHDPPDEVAERVRRALHRIAGQVPLVVIPGNHDELSYSNCIYHRGTWPGVLVRNALPEVVWRGRVGDCELAIAAAAYEAGAASPGMLLEFPEVSPGAWTVAVVHGTVTDHFSDLIAEGERCFRVSHRQVASAGYRYLALGHFHRRMSWRIDECVAAYPAPLVSPWGDDREAPSLLLVEPTDEGAVLHETKRPDVVGTMWETRRITVELDDTPDAIVSTLSPDGANTASGERLLRVVLSGMTQTDRFAAGVTDRLAAMKKPAIVIDNELVHVPPLDPDEAAAEPSLLGEFVRCWKRWREAEEPAEDFASQVLVEGLRALRREPK